MKGQGDEREAIVARHVLIVDDDPAIGQLLSHQLREAGFTTTYEPDPTVALRRLPQERPDVLLLDAIMPAMSGWELCGQIRRTSDVPIIMVTARDDDSDIVGGLRAGADDYVIKPFSTNQLLARIEAVLRRYRSEEARAVGEARNEPAVARRSVAPPPPAHHGGALVTNAVLATGTTALRAPVAPAPAPAAHFVPTVPPQPDAAKDRLGSYLRSLRVSKGISLYQAERECGVRWEFLQAIELNNFSFMPRLDLRRALKAYSSYLEADISDWLKPRAQQPRARVPDNLLVATLIVVLFAAITLIVMFLI
jgi:CheY-like chemotaxis protein/transcriptional regulator with XRE-family HTH domain